MFMHGNGFEETSILGTVDSIYIGLLLKSSEERRFICKGYATIFSPKEQDVIFNVNWRCNLHDKAMSLQLYCN